MDRLTIAEAERDFAGLVDRVHREGVGVELRRGEETIAYLTPALPRSALKVRDLKAFLQELPKLGNDADSFLADLRAIRREFPPEVDPWR